MGRWVTTKTGQKYYIPDEGEENPFKDKKDRQLEVNKKEADERNKVDDATLSKRLYKKFIDKDSYFNDPEHKQLTERNGELIDEYQKVRSEWLQLYDERKKHVQVSPEIVKALGKRQAEMLGTLDVEGEKIDARMKKLSEREKEIEKERDKITNALNREKRENNAIQKEEYKQNGRSTISENVKDKYPGFQKNTGTPYYEDLREKGKTVIVEMSPKEYLQECAYNIFDSTYEAQIAATVRTARHTVDLAKKMKAGTEMYMPVLNYRDKEQEGRHRAVAAMINGYDRIPVLIVRRR